MGAESPTAFRFATRRTKSEPMRSGKSRLTRVSRASRTPRSSQNGVRCCPLGNDSAAFEPVPTKLVEIVTGQRTVPPGRRPHRRRPPADTTCAGMRSTPMIDKRLRDPVIDGAVLRWWAFDSADDAALLEGMERGPHPVGCEFRIAGELVEGSSTAGQHGFVGVLGVRTDTNDVEHGGHAPSRRAVRDPAWRNRPELSVQQMERVES